MILARRAARLGLRRVRWNRVRVFVFLARELWRTVLTRIVVARVLIGCQAAGEPDRDRNVEKGVHPCREA
jgi:hypothetical protein